MAEFLTPRGTAGPSVRARLGGLLAARGITPSRVTVAFVDENGPKGGVAIRCAATVTLARRPPLRVECTDTTGRRAFDGVLEALDRRLARLTGRLRDHARRPKKYFAAKRLLEMGGLATGPPSPPTFGTPRQSRGAPRYSDRLLAGFR